VTSDVPAVVYTPESKLRSSDTLAKEMWHDLKASRELAWRLMVRDISAQYRQSLFGIFWAFLPPLCTALIFIFLNSRNIINIGETDIPYPVFAIVGTVLWQIFVYSLNAPLKVVSSAKPLLGKINFPKEALILSSLGQTFFDAGTKMVILIAVFFIFKIPVTWGVLFSLPAILVLILLGITLGLSLTPIGLLYTDIPNSLTIITTLWFLITPVVYPPPTGFPFSLLAIVNPVSPILLGARDLATKGVLLNPLPFFVVTCLVVLVLIVTWIVFRLSMAILIERIGT
jgi:lipopolysaccharide transport system permease protein